MTRQRRIGTFNLGNLARAGARVYETAPRSQSEYDEKRDALQEILGRVNADIVGVQEIFHLEALLDATKELYSPDQVFAPLPDDVTEDTARSPRVGLLCRLPIIGTLKVHRRFPRPHGILGLELREFRRPVLEARIELWPGLSATLFVAHLKSARPLFLEDENDTFPNTTAIAEARAMAVRMTEVAQLKMLLTEASTYGPVILVGDLNARPEDQALNTLKGRRAPEGSDREVSARFDAARLFDARSLARRSGGTAFGDTYVYGGRPQVLDHILFGQALTPWQEPLLAHVRRVQTYTDHLGGDPSLLVRCASDHGPVVATLEEPEP